MNVILGSLAVSGCSFRGNVARCSWSRGTVVGGAIYSLDRMTVDATEFADNAVQAEGALWAQTGAIGMYKSKLSVNSTPSCGTA